MVFIGIMAPRSYASFVVLYDFDTYSVAPLPVGSGIINVNKSPGNTDADVVQDSLQRFNLGPNNKALRLTDNSNTSPIVVQMSVGGPMDFFGGGADDNAYSFAFDFYDQSSGSDAFNFRGKLDQTNTTDGFNGSIGGGSLSGATGSYTKNALATMQINVTDEVAGLFDAYIIQNNQIVSSRLGDSFLDGGSNNQLNVLDFRTFQSGTGINILIDNIRVSGDLVAAIPEPATMFVLGLGGLALLRCRPVSV